ncbi:DNA polymerase IV [Solirubrobacter sp. CPCC 204708]|uniref:DNA polymerase IV n=1 Tax=Solirubrobacter deserti TaxID=2282478 RepID=A0ABT4RU45_9ACTN|nr:DNA polymerase IV [Solirubrobacter deserti]MBE2314488.1 DNA polymerase IV [Solirubrobacter deserti]MDA0142095.1 DNA polymerase IV [Solirubrobacter deserti]
MPRPAHATILHADLDSFFASVEQRDNPQLLGKPIAVGGGVITAASYEAKAYGVTGGMGGWTAKKLCPGLIFVKPRFEAYTAASKAVFKIFEDTSPLVEGLSIDEAFIDVRGMERIAGTPAEIAARLRARVRDKVGLPITVGVARTKFLAKVASAQVKPDGLLVVPVDGELEFLHPLPVEALWGVGKVTAGKLHARGLMTVAQVAELPEETLVGLVGKAAGRQLHALAHGRDARRVTTGVRRRSIGGQRALGRRGPKTPEALDATLVALVDRIGRRLRAASRMCRTIILRLRFDDFSRATRSHTLAEPTADSRPILAAARELLAGVMPMIEREGVTLLGLSLTNLEDADAPQLTLPLHEAKAAKLDAAVDGVRDRFGGASITRGVLVGRDPGIAMPHLPD